MHTDCNHNSCFEEEIRGDVQTGELQVHCYFHNTANYWFFSCWIDCKNSSLSWITNLTLKKDSRRLHMHFSFEKKSLQLIGLLSLPMFLRRKGSIWLSEVLAIVLQAVRQKGTNIFSKLLSSLVILSKSRNLVGKCLLRDVQVIQWDPWGWQALYLCNVVLINDELLLAGETLRAS